MIPTYRLMALVVPALVLVAAASEWPWLGYVGALWLCLASVLLTLDWVATSRGGGIRLTRGCDARLSLGDENLVTVEVANDGPRSVEVQVRDEFPEGFASSVSVLEGRVAPEAVVQLSYSLRPRRRGDYRFGALNLRRRSVLGLFWRQTRSEEPLAVRVFPSLREIRKYELLVRRGRLHEVGLVATRLQGVGTEFERLRDYLPDDDYRRINWKATARTGRPITVEYEVERAQNVVILLDLGRLMGTPVGEMDKLDHAVKACVMLSHVVLLRGDRVGLMTFADGVNTFLPPNKGRRQLHNIVSHLYAVGSQPVEPDYGAAFRRLASSKLRRSLVVVVTDLVDSAAAQSLVRQIALVSRHHLPLCALLSDPAVHGLAEAMPETPRAVFEVAVAQRLLDERREILEMLRRHGALVVDVPADRLTSSIVNRYLELKASNRL